MSSTPGRGHVDLEHGVFYRKAPGSKQTNKRQPPDRLRLDSSLTCGGGSA